MNGLFVSQWANTLTQTIQSINFSPKVFVFKIMTFVNKRDQAILPLEDINFVGKHADFGTSESDKWKEKMISRWKLSENVDNEQCSPLFIHVPQNEVQDFQKLIAIHKIQAVILSTPNCTA